MAKAGGQLKCTRMDRERAIKILLIQAILVLLTTGLSWFIGEKYLVSVLIGGLIATLANVIFALLIYTKYQAQNPERLAARMFGAELLKLLVIVAMFSATFYWVQTLNIGALIGAFLVVQITPPLLAHLLDK
jgi:ATP synthase protein I